MKKFIAALILSAGFISSANASLVTFEYSGICLDRCARLGLAPGNVVGGFIETTEAGAADGRIFGFEITDFAFSFGFLSFDSSTHTAFGQMAIGPFGQALVGLGGGLGGFTFAAFGLPNVRTDVLIGPLNAWTVNLPGPPRFDPSGLGIYTRGPAAIPEPGTLGLLGLGLLGAAFARRRSQRA
ncbi:MAG: PEP-CTERM sorting domain-containing protein [Pseudomonadota bacterium]